ncbi:MAG: hypothetical protein AB7K64_10865 [Variibacter sp.]
MGLILSKLILPPVLILFASLAARRWGDAIGGWLVGLPLTTGPVVAFLAIQYGPEFAVRASDGSLIGAAGQAAFSLGYALVARRGWAIGFLVGAASYAGTAFLLEAASLPQWGLLLVALAMLTLAALLIPHQDHVPSAIPAPWWDLPARMIAATVLVVAITAAADFVGASTAGVLASFPILGSTLAIFAHRMRGVEVARQVLRGLCLALYGFAACFFIIGAFLVKGGIIPTLVAALVVTLVVQGAALRLIRR